MKLAVAGATGMVGREILRVLEERIPASSINELYLFSSARSAGDKIIFNEREYTVEELTESSFDRGMDFALFSAGGGTSKTFAPIAAAKGCVVIDNSSAWRTEPDVPLVVPEVNPEDAKLHKGIIANPNCSTIQAVVALKPLHDRYKIKRIVYSTYQAVSGAGALGYDDLVGTLAGNAPKKFQYVIAGNCIPHIDDFTENGYTKEEMKMIFETRKIMRAPELAITATTVRVPVYHGHSESVNVEFFNDFDLGELVEALRQAPGVIVRDNPQNKEYPMPITAAGRDEVFVGRIRRDESVPSGVNLWVVSDNIRKGAATNAVQILELLM
ncbi:MAG: aspartate-semialdehyde dehydrogenase [Defluviitaleaceae bacterium]|nr:aspartate-semialdehyde dehydrogenase [Defluviitaleaceae bacterium]